MVTPTYPSSNPRVVKEADALQTAGLRVCVVFSQGDKEWARKDDAGLLASKPWAVHPVRWSRRIPDERLTYFRSTLRFHLARRLPMTWQRLAGVAERAECRTYPELTAAAARLPAHMSAALGSQGGRWGSLFGMSSYVAAWTRRSRQLLDFADRVVVVSHWLYDVLVRNGVGREKLVLSRHGLPQRPSAEKVHRARPGPGQPLRVGYLGRFDPIKGVHVLVDAVRQLPPSLCLELRLYGVARGPEERQYLTALRARARGDSRVVFAGEATDQSRWQVLAGLDVLAVPSLWLETGPFVVLEAFAAGLPVIGSNLGGIAELVTHGENGILAEAGNVHAWAAALKHLCENPEQVADLARHVPPVRQTNAVLEEMMRVYASVIDP